MEEQDKVLVENLRKTQESCEISDKAILAVLEMAKEKNKQPIKDSTTLFTPETIEATMKKLRKESRERGKELAGSKFGNHQQQAGFELGE